jgi:hypothetical protein
MTTASIHMLDDWLPLQQTVLLWWPAKVWHAQVGEDHVEQLVHQPLLQLSQ